MVVVVLGHRGMLGRRVMERFPDAEVIEARFTGARGDPLIAELDRIGPDWVINCIGATGDEPDLWPVNALLPHRIRWPLIQPSTDHVLDDTPYAMSKRLGECGVVVRCAIVDPEGGLLARAREQDTYGDPRRQWNGLTARRWAEVAEALVQDGWTVPRVIVPGSPMTNHFALQAAARDIFGWPTRTLLGSGPSWQAPEPDSLTDPIEVQLAEYL